LIQFSLSDILGLQCIVGITKDIECIQTGRIWMWFVYLCMKDNNLMRLYLQILLALTVFSACKNNRTKPTSLTQDSITFSIDSNQRTNDEKELLVKRGNYEDGQFKVTAYSRFMIPEKLSYDSSFYLEENILSLTNKNTNRTYTIQITDPCTGGSEIIIDNVTSSLGFRNPVFEITTPDCSDWFISEFVSFKKDALQNLFEISDSRPAKLIRSDDNTLTGTVKDRDEVVADFQDYPITVSLNNYSVMQTKPSRQKIDFKTEALEDIHGFHTDDRVLKDRYIIKKGTRLIVDSIFRDTHQVRLKLNDSLYIVCPFSETRGKLQGNAAG
jgi:hypothetical protein